MSETPDISMDLLELEDAVPPPNIGSVFLEEEGEEESPREEDEVVWTPFLGPNPMTEVEFLFEDLFLVEVSHVVIEPLQQVLGSTVDAYKWTLVRHLDEVFRFKLLKRHFQFQLYITHDSTWQRVSYSSTIEEELNRFQERTRLSRYCLRLKLNPGITHKLWKTVRAPDEMKALRMRMKKMQSRLHDLKMKISRVESCMQF